jgi:hypothetical protein
MYQDSKIKLKHLPIKLPVKDKEILKKSGTPLPPIKEAGQKLTLEIVERITGTG